MALNMDRLIADVAEQKTVNESAVTLLTQVAAELRATLVKLDAAVSASDPAAAEAAQAQLDAIAADIEAHTQALAVAVGANTIAAPAI